MRRSIALVGLGGISQAVHLATLSRCHANWDLCAVVDLSRERVDDVGARYGVPPSGRFTSVDALVDAMELGLIHVDAAVLATSGSHTHDASRLIRAGAKVLVEKPLAYSLGELERLERKLDALGRPAQQWLRVGYMKEYDPAVCSLRGSMAGIAPREVRIEVLHPLDARQLAFARLDPRPQDVDQAAIDQLTVTHDSVIREAIGDLADDPVLGRLYPGVVLGSVIHDIALARRLGVGLDHVTSATWSGNELPGSVVAHGVTSNGVPWSLGWHFIDEFPEYSETLAIHHEQGSARLHFSTPYILHAPTELTAWTAGPSLASRSQRTVWPQAEAFINELDALAGLVDGACDDHSSLEEARDDLKVAQRLFSALAQSAGRDTDASSEAGGVQPGR